MTGPNPRKTTMAQRRKLSAAATSQLLILNALMYGAEKGKEVSRYRFTRATLRTICGWPRLSEKFLAKLLRELYGMGWHFIDHTDIEFVIIERRKADVWPKLNSKRLNDMLKPSKSEDDIQALYDEFFEEAGETADAADAGE